MTTESNQFVEFKCLEVTQPIGKFYVGAMDSSELEFISVVDVRRLEKKEREVETYIGIQRPLSMNRKKEIGQYVNLVDATFPSNVIIALSSKNATYDAETGMMKILRKDDVAKVLDGQHRIAGLENYNKPGNTFQVTVTIFIDMELEDQAIVFATINKSHTKVNKSLVSDLFAFAKSRSPQKTAHNVVRALNEKEGSPFKDRIKILGTADDKEKETITQATFVENLLRYMSKNPMEDRDIYKRGKRPSKFEGNDLQKYFLRNLFIDEEDGDIAQLVWNYFYAVSNKWGKYWNEVEPSIILNRSGGFIALMRFFKDVYLSFNDIGRVISKEEFINIFEKIDIKGEDINKNNYEPGSGGQSKFYKELLEKSGLGD
ncbi:MAG: DGQHR domain-containing protein [Cyclobacteriaceae bacterium]